MDRFFLCTELENFNLSWVIYCFFDNTMATTFDQSSNSHPFMSTQCTSRSLQNFHITLRICINLTSVTVGSSILFCFFCCLGMWKFGIWKAVIWAGSHAKLANKMPYSDIEDYEDYARPSLNPSICIKIYIYVYECWFYLRDSTIYYTFIIRPLVCY